MYCLGRDYTLLLKMESSAAVVEESKITYLLQAHNSSISSKAISEIIFGEIIVVSSCYLCLLWSRLAINAIKCLL